MTSPPHPLATTLGLDPHPEGGWFRRVYTSGTLGAGGRPVMTSILYLLGRGEQSRWHVVDADEAWHFHEGSPITLRLYDPRSRAPNTVMLGPASTGCEPSWVVPAGCWQAASVSGEFGLVGCTVAPGFEFAGFSLVADLPDHEQHFQHTLQDWRHLL